MSKGVHLDLSNHFNHVWDAAFSFLDVKLKSLAELFTSLVMFSSPAVLVSSFVEGSNFQVLIGVTVVHLQDTFCIFVHFLVRLSDDEGVFSLASTY